MPLEVGGVVGGGPMALEDVEALEVHAPMVSRHGVAEDPPMALVVPQMAGEIK